jgi:hypothetical protein
MVTARDSRKQLEALRGAIADDAVELRLWWEEARGKAVREWRGLSAVARIILSLVPFQGASRGEELRRCVQSSKRPGACRD